MLKINKYQHNVSLYSWKSQVEKSGKSDAFQISYEWVKRRWEEKKPLWPATMHINGGFSTSAMQVDNEIVSTSTPQCMDIDFVKPRRDIGWQLMCVSQICQQSVWLALSVMCVIIFVCIHHTATPSFL